MKCRSCPGQLLGIEEASGRCGNCERATETAHETAVFLTRKAGNLTTPKPPKGNLTRTVVEHGPGKGEMETKQQRWKRKNAEANRAIHRAGQQRRRA